MVKPKVDQEVVVRRAWTHGPARPVRFPGRVVKVGRTLVTIEYQTPPGSRFTTTEQFYIDGGRNRDTYASLVFLTLEQADREDREYAAKQTLKAHGLTVEHRSTITLEQFEAIAAVLVEGEER